MRTRPAKNTAAPVISSIASELPLVPVLPPVGGNTTGSTPGDTVGIAVGDGVGLGVGDGVGLGVGDGVGLGVGDGVGLGVGVAPPGQGWLIEIDPSLTVSGSCAVPVTSRCAALTSVRR